MYDNSKPSIELRVPSIGLRKRERVRAIDNGRQLVPLYHNLIRILQTILYFLVEKCIVKKPIVHL